MFRFLNGGHAMSLIYLYIPIPDLPAEDPRVLLLVSLDLCLYLRCGQLWLTASQHSGPNAARLLISANAMTCECNIQCDLFLLSVSIISKFKSVCIDLYRFNENCQRTHKLYIFLTVKVGVK